MYKKVKLLHYFLQKLLVEAVLLKQNLAERQMASFEFEAKVFTLINLADGNMLVSYYWLTLCTLCLRIF